MRRMCRWIQLGDGAFVYGIGRFWFEGIHNFSKRGRGQGTGLCGDSLGQGDRHGSYSDARDGGVSWIAI